MSAYSLVKASGLRLSAVQRVLTGQGSPTFATMETVTAALGLGIEVRGRS